MRRQISSSMIEDLVEEGAAPEGQPPVEVQETPPPVDGITPAEGTPPPPPPGPTAETVVDFNALLQEKTGGKFKSVEDLLAINTQPVVQEINFANETSKKLFDYLKEGKVDDFISSYSQQQRLSNVGSLPTDDILKLRIKMESPEFTDEEVQEEFEAKYSVEKPDIDEELDDPKDIERMQKKYERELRSIELQKKKDLSAAKDFLKSKAEEIVIPDIAPKQQPAPAQESVVDEAEIQKYRQQYLQTIEPAMNGIAGLNAKYKDDEVEFETAYNIDAAEKAGIKKGLEDFTLDEYYLPRYVKQDGTFDTTQIAKDMYVLNNLDKIIEANVSQAVAQTKAALVKGIKGVDYTEPARRQATDPTKEDQMVDAFFSRT